MRLNRKKSGISIIGIFLTLPSVIMITISTISPMFFNLSLSFMKWNGLSSPVFYGIKNYLKIFTDHVTQMSFVNSIRIAILISTVAVFAGIIFAFLIYRMKRIEGAFYRLVFFIPVMLPLSIVALLFSLIYNYDMGLLNNFLRLVGLDFITRAWLADPDTLIFAIAFTGAWKQFGLTMMLTYTAICSIPKSLFDACEIDGCSRLRRIFLITLPLIRPTIQTAAVLTIIFSFKAYDLVWVMSRGGPGNLSIIVPLRMLEYGFKYNNFGAASATGTVFLLAVTGTVLLFKRFTKGEIYEF